MIISSHIFEAYLNCPSKCWLVFLGEKGEGDVFLDFIQTKDISYRTVGLERLMARGRGREHEGFPSEPLNIGTGSWVFARNIVAKKDNLESHLHAVERLSSEGPNKPVQLFPIRFIFANKLSKKDKLLLAFDAFVLSRMIGQEITHGKIIHGNKYAAIKVTTSALTNEVRKVTNKIDKMLSDKSSPNLMLNRHCPECEYRERCRQKAIEKDDLSLLAGIAEKEIKKLNSKGIFTVTQLSHTFRPRRRSKRHRDKREKYHHSLKALAIREKKIHIVGNPELKLDGTPIYFDVEGLPDRDFYYLIGLRFRRKESVVQHSLWANGPEEEGEIWREFIDILKTLNNPILLHYGSFEKNYLKKMCERYGEGIEGTQLKKVLTESVNILTILYGQIYFPGFSNGLKETAGFLGFNWTDADCSGLLSIAWRNIWENTHEASIKEKLLRYNAQDCEALDLLSIIIRQIVGNNGGPKDPDGNESIVRADFDKFPEKSKWHKFTSPISTLEYVNAAAHWDYQRDRVYARLERTKSKQQTKKIPKKILRVDMIITGESTRICPVCNRTFYCKGPERSKTLYDIVFGRGSIKLRLLKYVFKTYSCRKCGTKFGVPERFQHWRTKYGWNLTAYFFYQVVDLCIPQRTVSKSFNRLFGYELSRSTLHNLKIRTANYYNETKQQILERIIGGDLVHADETRANIKGQSAFVWVLTTFHEVYYLIAESREGEIAKNLLSNFRGVLVSDFYTAYDSIGCPQQKCLIHLMRDLNDGVLDNPFDEQLKQIVIKFGNLLKPMIETVDRYGLKKYFLKRHLSRVDKFYFELENSHYQSEAALKCKDRFERNRNTLFTFLKYDGVPWNNNNAEHAIKAFAGLRDVVAGSSTEKGTDEYLTLLSVCQTCKCSGLDFLNFLRSGEKDFYKFKANHMR